LISSNEVGYCEEIEKDFFVLNKTAKKTKKVKFSEYSTKAGEKFNEKEMIKILKKL
jgi:hypothetical protein